MPLIGARQPLSLRWLPTAVALAAASLILGSLADAADAPTIVFYGDNSLPPYESLEDGVAKGANVELIEAIGRTLNRPVEIRLMNRADIEAKVWDGSGDALSLVTRTAEREKIYAFSDETFPYTFSYFVMTRDFEEFRLDPHLMRAIAVRSGAFPEAFLRKQRPDLTLVPTTNLTEGMQLLLRGSVDAVAGMTWSGNIALDELDVATVRPLPVPFAELSGAIAVPLANSALLTDINQALRQLKADGTFDAIVTRWSGEQVVLFSQREVWLAAIAGALLLVALALSVALLLMSRARRRALDVEIGKRRDVERTLRESEARFRSMADDAPMLVLATDSLGACTYLSRRWYDFTGIVSDGGLGCSWLSAVHPHERDRIERALLAISASHGAAKWEYPLLRSDGAYRQVIHESLPHFSKEGIFHGHIGSIIDISDRKQAEERQMLLVREVSHRAKNALAVVQAVIRLTKAETLAGFVSVVEGRISALARAHNLLAASDWVGASLRQCVQEELSLFIAQGQVIMFGPEVTLQPEAVQPMAMVLHELTTNAIKYGALSRSDGTVTVTWDVNQTSVLRLSWREQGGPPIAPPTSLGFGATLLKRCVSDQLIGELILDWAPRGLICTLTFPRPVKFSPGSNAELILLRRRDEDQAPAVLIVEDEAMVACEMETILRDMGYRVIGPVGREDDAMNLLRSIRPDAAVLDINLHGQSIACLALHLVDWHVPVLFCSGYADLSSLPQRLQGVSLLKKPVDSVQFKEAIQRLIDAAKPPASAPVVPEGEVIPANLSRSDFHLKVVR